MMLHPIVFALAIIGHIGDESSPLPLPAAPAVAKSHYPEADTPRGGHGAPVAGIPCGAMEAVGVHIHVHLTLQYEGESLPIPLGVGIVHRPDGSACFYWLHTHDGSGMLHVEAPKGTFSLGQFFDIWGQPLSANGFLDKYGPVRVYLNGVEWHGVSPRGIILTPHENIVLRIRTTKPLPVPFAFPPGA